MYFYILLLPHIKYSNAISPLLRCLYARITYSAHLRTHNLSVLPMPPSRTGRNLVQAGFGVKAPIPGSTKQKALTCHGCNTAPFFFGIHTSTHLSLFFFSAAHLLSRSWQLLGGEDFWWSLLALCLSASRSLLHTLVSLWQPGTLEKNISAWQTSAGVFPRGLLP